MGRFKGVVILSLLAVYASLAAGQTSISGTVIDAKTNKTLIGVTIVEKGTTNGVFSDDDGKFTLKSSYSSGVLVVRMVGYKPTEYKFSGKAEGIVIEMKRQTLGGSKLALGTFLPIASGGKMGYGFSGMFSSKFPFLYRSTGLRLNLHGNYHSLLGDPWAGLGIGVSRPLFGITFHLNGGYQWRNLDGDFRYPYFNPEISSWVRIPGLRKYANVGLGYVKLYQVSEGSFFRISLSINII